MSQWIRNCFLLFDMTTCKRLLLLSCFLLLYRVGKCAGVSRTVAAYGQGVDIRGCGIQGNDACNTTQFAIFESNDGDEIILSKGLHTCDTNITTTVYGHSDNGIRFVDRDGTIPKGGIFIHGALNTKPEDVIYDCKHSQRAFAFMNEKEGRNTTLTGFSIYNGSAYAGGGVYIRLSAKPTFNHVVWIHNEAQGGGGGAYIRGSETKPTFNNCTFQENKTPNSQGGGGGVYIQAQASQAEPVAMLKSQI